MYRNWWSNPILHFQQRWIQFRASHWNCLKLWGKFKLHLQVISALVFYIYLFMSLVIYLLICFTESKNHSLLLPLTDFRQVISPLIMVLVYLREIRQAPHHLKSLHQKQWWSFLHVTFYFTLNENKLWKSPQEEKLAQPLHCLTWDITGLCLYYKCIWDTRQNKPTASEDFKHLIMAYLSTEIKCKVLYFKFL